MAQTDDVVTLEEVLRLAKRLSPLDKVRLIEHVAPDIERDMADSVRIPGRSLLGVLKGPGPAPAPEEIDAARGEAWADFPRHDT